MENQNPNSTAVRKQPPKIDRLSSLPDGILEEILSLLPTSAAAATSVLSRRWGQLWTRVTRLHFESYDEDLRTFFTSVDSALSRLDSFSNIRYFYLRFNFMAVRSNPTAVELRKGEGEEEDDILYSVLNRCLSRLCGLHTQRIDVGVSYFIQICVQNSVVAKTTNSVSDDDDDVGLESSNCRVICLPQCVFQSETLTELLLNNWFRFKLPEFVNLPNLQKLSLRVFDDRDLMQTLFKSLPSLEDLTLLSAMSPYDDHRIEISAHNLKKIWLNFGEVCTKAQILIDAPKLEHISISSFESLLFIRFVSIPSALSSAQLILDARRFLGDDPVNQTMELLKGISCVKSLAIKCLAVGILNRVNMDALPSFQNLTHLELLFAHGNYDFDIPIWLLRKVKTIDVKACWEYFEMSAVKNILSRADALERFCVSFSDVNGKQIDKQQKEEALVQALFMLPRVSTRCEIQFKGMVVSASTNDS